MGGRQSKPEEQAPAPSLEDGDSLLSNPHLWTAHHIIE